MVDSLWLEDKYVNLLSPVLQRFSKKDSYTYNFRCPFCGDSDKNKFKARGYIYHKKGSLFYRCHNCGRGTTFKVFMKEVDPRVYDEFRLELLKEKSVGKPKFERQIENFGKERFQKFEPLKGLTAISKLKEDHPAKKYVVSRLIPSEQHYRLFYCPRFMEWVNTVIPGKFDEKQLKGDEPRLVIPFVDENGYVFAATGRSFKRESIRYLTVKFNEDEDKIFGLDKVDQSKRVYVVEGPIDSLFIDNSIAFAGASGKMPKFKDSVVVLDNEPRNREIVKTMQKFIDAGEKVCIWPSSFEYKDVNESIMGGMTREQVKALIDENTWSGLTAKIMFNEWKKV